MTAASESQHNEPHTSSLREPNAPFISAHSFSHGSSAEPSLRAAFQPLPTAFSGTLSHRRAVPTAPRTPLCSPPARSRTGAAPAAAPVSPSGSPPAPSARAASPRTARLPGRAPDSRRRSRSRANGRVPPRSPPPARLRTKPPAAAARRCHSVAHLRQVPPNGRRPPQRPPGWGPPRRRSAYLHQRPLQPPSGSARRAPPLPPCHSAPAPGLRRARPAASPLRGASARPCSPPRLLDPFRQTPPPRFAPASARLTPRPLPACRPDIWRQVVLGGGRRRAGVSPPLRFVPPPLLKRGRPTAGAPRRRGPAGGGSAAPDAGARSRGLP